MATAHWRLAAFWALLALPLTASAQQAWPTSTVTLLVPFSAGSGTDNVARIVAAGLSAELGQSVVVDNRAGGQGLISAQHARRARADGYTLFMTTNTTHSANPWLIRNLPYDPITDFTPITRVGELPFVLAVNASLPVHNVQELVDYARSHPGRLSYATPASTSLVGAETLKAEAGLDILQVPYRSSPQALSDLLGNVVNVYFADLGSLGSARQSDRIRMLGVGSAHATPLLPGVPPIADTIAGFDITSWNGVFAPAGLDEDIRGKIDTALQATLADPEIVRQLAQIGFEVRPSASPEEFASYVQEQLAFWGQLIRQAGIEMQ